MNRTDSLRPLFLLLFLGTSWGLYFSLLKVAVLSGISYVGILTLTTVGVALGMTAITLLRGRKPLWSRKHVVFYGVCALSGYLLPMVIELWVIAHMPAGVLTLIVSMAPLATLLLAWLIKTDTVNAMRIGGISIGAFAIFAILLPDANRAGEVALQWLLLATLVPFCYAVHHNFTARYWPEGSDSYQVACGEAIVAGLLLLLFSGFHWEWQDLQSFNRGHAAILIMAAIALIDIYIYFELIRIKGPIYTSHANYFMVVSGVAWGMLIFDERPSPMMWLSALLLVASLYLVGRGEHRQAPAESKSAADH